MHNRFRLITPNTLLADLTLHDFYSLNGEVVLLVATILDWVRNRSPPELAHPS